MRQSTAALLVGLSIGWSTPLHAQLPEWVSQLLTSARLPVEAAQARREGVPDRDIRSVIEAMRNARVPAHEATAVIDTARAVRREHGPVDNFGAFVQAQLASGKRGRELAAAIRAEHARAGKGNAAGGAGQGQGQGQGQGRAEGQGRGRADTARATGRDTARGRGRPDAQAPGRPGAQGEKPAKPGRGNPARPNR